jgi:hypothetical protein
VRLFLHAWRFFCTMKLFLILDVFAWWFLYLLSYRISLTTILTTIVNSTTKRKPSYQVNTISVNYKLRGREHGYHLVCVIWNIII